MPISSRHTDGLVSTIWRLLLPQVTFWFGWFILNAIAAGLPFVSAADGIFRYLVELAFFGAVLLWALLVFGAASRWLDQGRLADRGLHFSAHWLRHFGAGLLLGAALVTIIFAVQLGAGWVIVTQGWRTSVLGVPLVLGLVFVAIKAVLVASWEELVFRAGLIPGLAGVFTHMQMPKRLAIAAAVAIPALTFGLAHLANPNATLSAALAISIAGMFTGVIYVRTGSLALPIGAHAAWNFFQANVYGFPLSGQRVAKTSALVIEQHGPPLWTGGSAGPEAGLLCLVVILVATALVLRFTRERAEEVGSTRS